MNPLLMMGIMAAASALSSNLGGSKGERGSTYSPQAQGAMNDILRSIKDMKGGAIDITQQPGYQQGNEWLMSMFNDPEFFKSFEAPLQRQFQEETVPGLANRFASMGSGGSTGSTAFRNQLAREGSNLSTNIAALRGQMQQGAIPQLLNYAQQPFSNLMSLYQQALQPTQNVYQPPTNPWANLLAPAISAGAQGYAQQWGQNQANLAKPIIQPGQNPSTV